MDISGKRAFELLEKISFVRVGGTPEELKAANILIDSTSEVGVEGALESFEVSSYDIKKVQFEVLEPFQATYEATGYGLSGNTPDEGIAADFKYVQQAEEIDLIDAKDKIVLLNAPVSYRTYRMLNEAGVKGFITFSGSVLDDVEKTDIDARTLRKKHLKYGSIPGVTIRVKDAMEVVKKNATKVKITLQQETCDVDSHNVIAEVKGTKYPDEVVAFVAHYDSTPYSPGAYDNGAGSVIIMEMLRYYKENPPARTIRFIWFGSEERGLIGSKAYVKSHKKELDKIKLVVNVDMAGGILGEERAIVTADDSLVHMVEYLSSEIGHPITVTQDIYSSDSTPFANKGVPAISFARFGGKGSTPGHNRFDLLEHLSAESLEHTASFLKTFSERIINSYVFPVPRTMPEKLVESIDKYMTRGKDDMNGKKQTSKKSKKNSKKK